MSTGFTKKNGGRENFWLQFIAYRLFVMRRKFLRNFLSNSMPVLEKSVWILRNDDAVYRSMVDR